MTQSTDDRALLIKKLLNKAEAKGTTEAERDSLNAKAAELMIKWGIEDAMIADVDRLNVEVIVKREFEFDVPKSYSYEYAVIGVRIAEALNCKGILQQKYDRRVNLLIVGFESDVEHVAELARSLVLQCTIALGPWYANARRQWWTGTNKFNAKRSFIQGFARGIRDKLAAWKKSAVAESAPGAELVLVDRSRRVDSWINENMSTEMSRGRRYETGATAAGWGAGQRANVGGGSLGDSRKRIGG